MAGTSTLHRYASEIVGTLVLAALILFVLALFVGGRVDEWLNPGMDIRVVMPSEGLYGLSRGANVQMLGSDAGQVRNIVIQPDESIYAEVHVNPGMSDFVRRDSKVTIKKRFGVAGDSFLEITKGRGQPLDPDYAVLDARTDKAASVSVDQVLSELRDKVVPVIEDAASTINSLAVVTHDLGDPEGNLQQTLANLNLVTQRIVQGEGAFGRLMVEDALIRELEKLAAGLNQTIGGVGPVLDELQVTVHNISVMSGALSAQSKNIPDATKRLGRVLDSVDEILVDLKRTTPQLPRITRNMADTTESLPVLLIQTQETVAQLELLIRQLRASWIVGGGAEQPPQPASRTRSVDAQPASPPRSPRPATTDSSAPAGSPSSRFNRDATPRPRRSMVRWRTWPTSATISTPPWMPNTTSPFASCAWIASTRPTRCSGAPRRSSSGRAEASPSR
jgi:phospholipid/cholesterol/gamma-HCH transport system substrate-binding protein